MQKVNAKMNNVFIILGLDYLKRRYPTHLWNGVEKGGKILTERYNEKMKEMRKQISTTLVIPGQNQSGNDAPPKTTAAKKRKEREKEKNKQILGDYTNHIKQKNTE